MTNAVLANIMYKKEKQQDELAVITRAKELNYKRYGNDGYILKCDVRKYFNSISHEVLLKLIEEIKVDHETRGLLLKIVESYEHTPGRGIPMGNQTSQW